jgi:rubredoxin
MRPHARTVAPGPAGTGGQYVVSLRGSLMDRGAERQAIATSFLDPHESPLELTAGTAGLDAIVLNFPRLERAAQSGTAAAGAFKTWHCVLCGFVYDEAAGMPDEGVAPGTRWQDVPESWSCPDCFAGKQDFDMVEV